MGSSCKHNKQQQPQLHVRHTCEALGAKGREGKRERQSGEIERERWEEAREVQVKVREVRGRERKKKR